jgi:hypothetical protein
LKSDNLELSVRTLDVYKEMLTDTDLREISERNNYVSDVRNQVEGLKSIHNSVVNDEGCLTVSENLTDEKIHNMLSSDAEEIYQQISAKHEQVYD